MSETLILTYIFYVYGVNMFLMLFWVYIHTGQANKCTWPRWFFIYLEINPVIVYAYYVAKAAWKRDSLLFSQKKHNWLFVYHVYHHNEIAVSQTIEITLRVLNCIFWAIFSNDCAPLSVVIIPSVDVGLGLYRSMKKKIVRLVIWLSIREFAGDRVIMWRILKSKVFHRFLYYWCWQKTNFIEEFLKISLLMYM